ncbi:MAG: helix-hairpin-helix domain-containing protein [Agathobacter sp.]|nr:helix-hairpin-helix domain-containing protein [Agathobacter sp.]
MRKNLCKVKSVLLGTLIVVFLCACGNDTAYYVETEESGTKESQDTEQCSMDEQESDESAKMSIYVYVCGQIQKPGVYILPEGSRVCDVFALAGGFTEGAATDYWNQARLLTDGEMLYVPTIEEAQNRYFDGNATSHESTDDSSKVNINTASKEELMTLPGIGESKALAIITYRQENGAFSSIEELKKVEGIKDGVFSKMKEYIEI